MSFPLGRPLGNPGDPPFQTAVLKEALALLEYPDGPVLVDYQVDSKSAAGTAPLACPVNFQTRPDGESSVESIIEPLRAELSTMQSWHDLACQTSGKAATGASGLVAPEIVDLFAEFMNTNMNRDLRQGQKLADLLRLAAEDLKTFYFVAVSAQPGQATDVHVLADWFWGETYAAACINEVRKACLRRKSKDFQLAGKLLLVPRNQLHRFA